MNGWMSELLFFVGYFSTERPPFSATSSLSSHLSGLLLLLPAFQLARL